MLLPPVDGGETLVRRLGVIIIPISILIPKIHAQVTEMLAIRSTEHKSTKILVLDLRNGQLAFSIARIGSVLDSPVGCECFDLCSDERGDNAN